MNSLQRICGLYFIFIHQHSGIKHFGPLYPAGVQTAVPLKSQVLEKERGPL